MTEPIWLYVYAVTIGLVAMVGVSTAVTWWASLWTHTPRTEYSEVDRR